MVSVIIPAFNAENTIRRCIDSLLVQTYSDFEIIAVNDGSCDSTESLIISLAEEDGRIRLVNQKNGGVSAARNKGIEESTGEFLCFVDSDDVVDPCFLESLMKLYVPGCLPVVDMVRTDSPRSALKKIKSPYTIACDFAADFFCGDLGQAIAFSVCNKIFLKETILGEDIKFDESLKVGEDMLFVFRYLCCCHDIRISRDAAYYYSIDDSSAMNSYRDYTPQYEDLLSAMKSCRQQNKQIDNNVLSRWSLNIMLSISTNQYIMSLPYSEFRVWWNALLTTELYRMAKSGTISGGIKRRQFQFALKHGHKLQVFMFIKLNKWILRRS